ncbi:MAG: hypothetical protein HY866_02215 [Chloroflexi bacterium]|nr:hypothetical protein [Chloroflexota bacterium]
MSIATLADTSIVSRNHPVLQSRPVITEHDLANALRRFCGAGVERTNDPAECAAFNCGYLRKGKRAWHDGAPYYPWFITPAGQDFLADYPLPAVTPPVLSLPWIIPPVALLPAPQVKDILLLPAVCPTRPKPYHATPVRERQRFMADFQSRLAALDDPQWSGWSHYGTFTVNDGKNRAFSVDTSHNRTVMAAPINLLKADTAAAWYERYAFGPLSVSEIELLKAQIVILPAQLPDVRGEIWRCELAIQKRLNEGPRRLEEVFKLVRYPDNIFFKALKNLGNAGRVVHLPYARLQLAMPDVSESRAAFEQDIRSELAARAGHNITTISKGINEVTLSDLTTGQAWLTCRNGWNGTITVQEFIPWSSARRPAWTRAYSNLAYDPNYLKSALDVLVRVHRQGVN